MTSARVAATLLGGGIGFVLARALIPSWLGRAPKSLFRENVTGRSVPAVLGRPAAVAGLAAIALLSVAGAAGWSAARTGEIGAAVAAAVVLLGIAGAYDDRRGNEAARGFAGHLRALSRGHLTGGSVKLVAGAVAGLVAAALLDLDRSQVGVAGAIATLLLVPLAANTVNLLDRAPGRAAKVTWLAALPLLVWGHPAWSVAAGGVLGALGACLVYDLREEGMLGDAGANPLGALLGIGIAAATGAGGRWVAVAVLVGLNAASERWSFSAAIERVAWLHALDRWGRK